MLETESGRTPDVLLPVTKASLVPSLLKFTCRSASISSINFIRSLFASICVFHFISDPLYAGENQNDSPLKFEIANVIDISSNVSGGIRRDTAVLYNLDVMAELDAGYFGLKNGTFFLYGLVNNAQELNPTIGDFQVTSNIDNSEIFRLYEFWYEQAFADGEASLKFGLYDLNSEFDAIEPAGLFLNSSHGIGADFAQSGENGPSIFPSTSLSVRMQYRVSNGLILRAAVLDAVPNDPDNPKRHKLSLDEGALLVGEADYSLPSGDWRFAAGLWHYTSSFDPVDDQVSGKIGGNTGAYAFAEGRLSEKTSAWIRLGFANQDINQISHYIGSGLVWTGPFESRPDDALGFAVAMAGNGSVFRDVAEKLLTPVDKYEVAYELTYRFEVNSWLSIQPDIQYVQNPGMDPGLEDAVVISVRLEFGRAF